MNLSLSYLGHGLKKGYSTPFEYCTSPDFRSPLYVYSKFQTFHVWKVQPEFTHFGRRLVSGHHSSFQHLGPSSGYDSWHLYSRRCVETGSDNCGNSYRIHWKGITRGMPFVSALFKTPPLDTVRIWIQGTQNPNLWTFWVQILNGLFDHVIIVWTF